VAAAAKATRPTTAAVRAEPVTATLQAQLAASPIRGSTVCVALSGGMDSVVLLHALHAIAAPYGCQLTAMHVNHGLSPHARQWESACRALCARLGVPFAARRVKVAKRGRGLEAAAREARYAALGASKAARVALAHHLDDQAETVLLNLLRGAGLAGAAAMPRLGALPLPADLRDDAPQAWRPLLDVPRMALADYARRHGLQWVEDESNADASLTRNWLRARIAPALDTRFPRWREALARSASHFAEARSVLEADGFATLADRLRIADLQAATKAHARLRLRSFVAANGARAPSAARLNEMLRQLLAAGSDSAIALEHDGMLLRAWRGGIALLPATLPQGEVVLTPTRGAGIDMARLKGAPLELRVRSGSERIRLAANRPSRSLKNLFQEAGIPPWERECMPLLFCGPELVWVPGIGIADAFRASGRRAGLLPEWHRLAPGPVRLRVCAGGRL